VNGGNSFGSARNGAMGGNATPTASASARQLQRQLREYANTADDLRRRLAQAGVNPKDLDAVARELRSMDLGDPKGLQQLKASVDRLKRFEFDLRKKVGGDSQQLFLSGSDEVPPGFRQAIEEYYRSLAKKVPR